MAASEEPPLIVPNDEINELLQSRAWLRVVQAMDAQRAQWMYALMDRNTGNDGIRDLQGCLSALGWVASLPRQMAEQNAILDKQETIVDMSANAALEDRLRKRLQGVSRYA